MALTIEGATVGFDANGLQNLIEQEIKINLIENTTKHLKDNYDTLTEALREIWQGQSEQIFEKNIGVDLVRIVAAIQSAGEQLQTEVTNMGAEVVHADQELVKPRSL